MEQLMAHAMASHNPQQHQFHPGQIDMKHFGPPFAQPPHGMGLPQQAVVVNPNMGMNPHHQQHPSIALQIPDPHKMGKPEQGYNKMPHQLQLPNQNPYHTECQYPLMSPAPLAQNLTVNKKEKSPVSSGGSSSFGSDDPWLNSANANSNAIATTSNGKKKKGKSSRRSSEPGGTKAAKSQARRFSANSNSSQVSVPEKEKAFECPQCCRRFTQRIGMLQHQRRHTGERPFLCTFDACGKRFTQKSGLVQHERLHTNVKPFLCTMCDKAFTQKSGLVQHERTHTGEKPYGCGQCSKAFSQLSGLKQHKKVHERSSEAK